MNRKTPFAPGEYYHTYNRGARKHAIFDDSYDRSRFIYSLLIAQSPAPLLNVGHYASQFEKFGKFNIRDSTLKKLFDNRLVELVCFILMDNHFHIVVREIQENGISKYMQKLLDSYTKYSNAKYGESGHLFQGPFRSVHISTNDQLLYVSAYIHRNIRDDRRWKGKEHQYPWSSFQDYITENRWGDLLKRDAVLGQFKDQSEYLEFTKGTATKDHLDFESL